VEQAVRAEPEVRAAARSSSSGHLLLENSASVSVSASASVSDSASVSVSDSVSARDRDPSAWAGPSAALLGWPGEIGLPSSREGRGEDVCCQVVERV